MSGEGVIGKVSFWIRRHPSSYRIRYALITRLGGDEFSAPPATSSGGSSTADIPPAFQEAVSRLDLDADPDFADARKLAFDLSRGHRRGPGLGTTSTSALRKIYSGARAGVCSDYTQVFLGLCRAAGVAVREWGMCASFSRSILGHSFAEVYSRKHAKWIFLDPMFSIYAVDAARGPLSVAEIVDLIGAGSRDSIETRVIDADGYPGERRRTYFDRYFNSDHAFFLLSNNDVFRQDRFLRWIHVVPLPLLHFLMILAGSYQRFHVYTNPQNVRLMTRRVEELRRWFRRSVIMPLVALALAGAVLLPTLLRP